MEVLLRAIPKDWSSKPLGESAKLFGGYAFKSVDYAEKGIRLLKISNVSHSKIIWEEESFLPLPYWNDFPEYRVNKGDIVLAMTRPIISTGLKISIFNDEQKVLLNQRVGKFIINDSLKPIFLFYFLNQKYILNQIELRTSESNQPNISSNEIENIPIWYPTDLSEQQKIASILSNIDSLIQQTQKIITQTQNLKKGLMQKLLTKGIGHTKFKKEFYKFNSRILLGNIPEDWDIVSINKLKKEGFIIEFQDGNHGELHPKDNDFSHDGRPFITATQIDEDGNVNLNQCKKLPEEFCKKLRIGFSMSKDVLFTHNATVGRVAILPTSSPNCIVGTSVTYYRLNEKKLNRFFFAYMLGSRFIKKQYGAEMDQTTRQQFSLLKQAKLKIPIPTIIEQQKIAFILSNIDSQIQKQQRYESELLILKKGLVQKLLTGQIRVKV